MFFIDDRHGWAACSLFYDLGFILKTTDGGLNWTACNPIVSDLYNIHFTDSLHGGAVGGSWFYSYVLLTENNFDTLSYLYRNEWNQLPSGIYYQNDSTIWMSGYPAVIYKSTNGGATFIEYDTSYASEDQTDWIHDFQFFGNTGYAYSYSFLLKMVDTLNTSINDPGIIHKDIQIFPNPVSEKLKVSISLPKPEITTLEIVSIEGKSIQKMVKYLHEGNNDLFLNVENMKTGIYLLKIKSTSGNYCLKFIKQP